MKHTPMVTTTLAQCAEAVKRAVQTAPNFNGISRQRKMLGFALISEAAERFFGFEGEEADEFEERFYFTIVKPWMEE